MEWLRALAQNPEAPVLAALSLGLLTAIAPCPLATNITATAYIARTVSDRGRVMLSGLLYTAGRMTSYVMLCLLIMFGMSKFQVASIFQGHGELVLGPLLLLIGLVMLNVIRLDFLFKGNLTDRLAEKLGPNNLFSSFLLGMLFALAFCPYSGALFFAMLLPMTLSSSAGILLPAVFSLGTGIPVIFFAVVIAYSMERLGSIFQVVRQVEKVMRLAVGLVFIGTGLYLLGIQVGWIGG